MDDQFLFSIKMRKTVWIAVDRGVSCDNEPVPCWQGSGSGEEQATSVAENAAITPVFMRGSMLHSARSVTIGSTRVARQAGKSVASSAAASSASETAA